jgi:tetratricopeptide (TPR) repeat protein
MASFVIAVTSPAFSQDKKPKKRLQSKQEKVAKLVDLARQLRATGRYDGAVASYLKAKEISVTKDLKKGIVTECGEVLVFQKKYKKALRMYSQARLSKLELKLLMTLKLYRRAVATARLYNVPRLEGDALMALGQAKEALKVYRLGKYRAGEARALIRLGFKEQAIKILAAEKRHEESAQLYEIMKKPDLAKTQWQLAKALYEKRLVKLINDIRQYRSELDPDKRKKLRMSELTGNKRRILRLKLARRYRLCARGYEDLATVQEALGQLNATKKLLSQTIKFLNLYKTAFTDNGKDQFGVDRINQSDFLTRIGSLQKKIQTP